MPKVETDGSDCSAYYESRVYHWGHYLYKSEPDANPVYVFIPHDTTQPGGFSQSYPSGLWFYLVPDSALSKAFEEGYNRGFEAASQPPRITAWNASETRKKFYQHV